MTNQHCFDDKEAETPKRSSSKKAKDESTLTLRINANTALSVILLLLFGFSTVQAIELSRIKSSVENGVSLTSAADAAETATTSTSTSSSGSSAIDNLPDMVGGC